MRLKVVLGGGVPVSVVCASSPAVGLGAGRGGHGGEGPELTALSAIGVEA